MRYVTMVVATSACFLAALLLVGASTGCGGSGGGGVPVGGTTTFNGAYFVQALSGVGGAVPSVTGEWGISNADGAGNLTGTTATNTNGIVAAASAFGPFLYTEGAGGALAWQGPSLPGTDIARGGVSSTGSVAALATVLATTTPRIYLLSRQQGTFSDASLNGVYLAFALNHDFGAPGDESWVGGWTFDGAGGLSAPFSSNQEGTITLGGGGAATYSVGADGAMNVNSPVGLFTGGVLLGGDLFILGGASAAAGRPALIVGIRQSTSATNATLDGPYHIVGLETEASPGGYQAVTGTAVSNGTGSITVNFTRNDDGVITTDPPSVATYAVAATGVLTVSTSDTLPGAVSPGGEFAVTSGPSNAGGQPQLFFLVK